MAALLLIQEQLAVSSYAFQQSSKFRRKQTALWGGPTPSSSLPPPPSASSESPAVVVVIRQQQLQQQPGAEEEGEEEMGDGSDSSSRLQRDGGGGGGARRADVDDVNLDNLPPVLRDLVVERREYQINLGRALDTLRKDYETILTRQPGTFFVALRCVPASCPARLGYWEHFLRRHFISFCPRAHALTR